MFPIVIAFVRPSFAYVDVERAEFAHFLISRFGQLFGSKTIWKKSNPYVLKLDKYMKSPNGKAMFDKYGPEWPAHFGWRLGCNLGWEVAGALIMIRDHRKVNLKTVMQDSLSPGLLLYPFGQVAGQAMAGDAALTFLNKYTKQKMMNQTLSWLLVEEAGVPKILEKQSIQKSASRLFGVGLGTYLGFALFDLGHNIFYKKQPLLKSFAWDKYKALAMAGFTYGGYVGHNFGFWLSWKYLFPKIFSMNSYQRLVGKSAAYIIKSGNKNIAEMPPKERFKFRLAEKMTNQDKLKDTLLWQGSQWTASVVNALSCAFFAWAIPTAVREIEEWLTENEWENFTEPDDTYEIYSSMPEKERLGYVDSILKEINDQIEKTIKSAAEEIMDTDQEGENLNIASSALAVEERLRDQKVAMFDSIIVMGLNTQAILSIVDAKISDIKNSADLLKFVEEEYIPVMGLENYSELLIRDLKKDLEETKGKNIPEIRDNLRVFMNAAIPQIYSSHITNKVADGISIEELNG